MQVMGRRESDEHEAQGGRDRPVEEPPNSTVDDWHGQKVADDMELVDELLDETGGDLDEAEERFEERTAAKDPKRDINRPKHPLTLKRYPDGVDAPHFYEKRCPAYRPDRIPLLEMPSKRHGVVHYCSIEDTAGLMWLANLASLEIHPYLARAPHLDRPTAIVFDLAPGQELVYPRGRVALLLRDALAEVGMTTLVKSTGSKGLHVTMPIDGTEDYRHQGVRPRARSPAGTALAPTWSSPRCTESPVRAR
jgi:hypothetical protein